MCLCVFGMSEEGSTPSHFVAELAVDAWRSFEPVPELQSHSHLVTEEGNFIKGCKISPDGCCVLTASERSTLHIMDIPFDMDPSAPSSFDRSRNPLVPSVSVQEGESLYDFAWYPLMHSAVPASCGFVTSTKDRPIHMWDAFTGKLRASYRAFDYADEIVAACSLAFNPAGTHLFAGYTHHLRRFDVAIPGRECECRKTWQSGSGRRKRGADGGQRGLFSCLACPTDPSLPLLAAGTYTGTVGLYDADSLELVSVWPAHSRGVSQLLFSRNSALLITAGRRSQDILVWDYRQLGATEPLYTFCREGDTNQRLSMDVDCSGRFLLSGNTNGTVSCYDLCTGEPLGAWLCHPGDVVNGVSFHPTLPAFACSSGTRRVAFPKCEATGHTDSDSSSSEEELVEAQDQDIPPPCVKFFSVEKQYAWVPWSSLPSTDAMQVDDGEGSNQPPDREI